jgi:hypothetical protein
MHLHMGRFLWLVSQERASGRGLGHAHVSVTRGFVVRTPDDACTHACGPHAEARSSSRAFRLSGRVTVPQPKHNRWRRAGTHSSGARRRRA